MSSKLNRLATVLAASAMCTVVGCSNANSNNNNLNTEDAGSDAGPGETDAGDVDASAMSCEVPTEGYASSVGTKLRPFTLDRCFVNDSGVGESAPFAFYENGFCDARFTVLSIAAGWCGPCNAESEEFNEQITQGYGPRGVRLIQVLVQDYDYLAPNVDFCNEWVNRHNLANPELMDPTGVTQIYFPGGSLPSTIIVDNTGTIVFRENGSTTGLISLRNKLDQLLAGE